MAGDGEIGGACGPGPACVVVGGEGFIGSQVCRAFTRAGIATTRIVRATGPGRALESADFVVYAAGTVTPALAERDPAAAASDLRDLRQVLSACVRGGRRPAVVLLSSGGTVYSPHGNPPFRETSELGPTSVYGRAKLAQEQAVLGAGDGIRPVVLRLANVYGPGQSTHGAQGVVAHWLAAVAAGRPLHLIGEPTSRRDYVHVDDVATAMLKVLRRPVHRAVLNIGSGAPTSLAELSSVVRTAVDRPIEITRSPGRAFDRSDVWLDIRRAAEVLGWTPRIGLADGIARTWQALMSADRPVVSR